MIQNNGILGTKQIRAVNIFINSVTPIQGHNLLTLKTSFLLSVHHVLADPETFDWGWGPENTVIHLSCGDQIYFLSNIL